MFQDPQDGHAVPLTMEGEETALALAVPRGAPQVTLAGGALAQELLLATCLPRLSGPPAGTQTCPNSASQRATCKKETEAGIVREAAALMAWSCLRGLALCIQYTVVPRLSPDGGGSASPRHTMA